MKRLMFFILLALLASPFYLPNAHADTIWLEGESGQVQNTKPNVAGWGKKEFLSEEKWLQISVDADKLDSSISGDAVILSYPLEIKTAGQHAIWNRIGYEFARSAFEWRVDKGGWKTVTPEQLTTDLMALETWNEVAWLKLGEENLASRTHKLEIKLSKIPKTRILYASDALCITDNLTWHPYGKVKPEAEYQTEKDKDAAKYAFSFPEKAVESGRQKLALSGDWEVCRSDEDLPPADIAVPLQITDMPKKPYWSAISVPSDKNTSRPDLLFAHRLWYKTKVFVPDSQKDQSFVLTFPRNSLNTTVYVNGVYCGFNKNPNVKFDFDISKAIKSGQINTIYIGIRDNWYGYSNSPTNPMKLRRCFNYPISIVGNGFQDLAYPIWNAWQSGILQTPILTSTAKVYISDVFVKPNVAKKQLIAEVILHNTTDKEVNTTIEGYEIIDVKTGKSVKEGKLDAEAVIIAAGETKMVALNVPFSEAKLWWPEPNAQLYILRLKVASEKARDVSETKFGFREWGVRGKDFTLNGQVWHGWADLNGGSNATEWLANYRKSNQRFMRLMGYAQGGPTWMGKTPEEALNFFDENCVVVRRSGDLDGEAIGYNAIENDPELKKKYGTEIKQELLDNWRDQMVAQVKAERNHPSIHLWSIENEFLYINCINLYGNLMDKFEAEAKKCGDAVALADPTRTWMVDGGGSGKGNLFPVQGDHYVADLNAPDFLERSYGANPTGGGRGRWVWDEKRPRYLGEDYFATGINPADFAILGGEENFVGKVQTRRTMSDMYKILNEGYRWAGFGAWHFWVGRESLGSDQFGYAKSNAPRAVFVREHDSVFASGEKVTRTYKIFNDSFENTPMTFTRTLLVNGKAVWTKISTHPIKQGESEEIGEQIPMPTIAKNTNAMLSLVLKVGENVVFQDTKVVRVFPRPLPKTTVSILVYDPQKRLPASMTVGATRITTLTNLPLHARLLLIAPDALSESESTSPVLAAWAAQGGRVIVLSQRNPLKYGALPAAIEPSNAVGNVAFLEDESHPALLNLQSSDFFGGLNFKNAYQKPTRGAKSLIQCGQRLAQTALVEVPVGKGLIILCQFETSENALSQALINNLKTYASLYEPIAKPVTVTATGKNLLTALDATGLKYTVTNSPLSGTHSLIVLGRRVLRGQNQIMVVEATPANLKALSSNKVQIEAFQNAGGWIILSGLTPEGLADYNKLVGFNHMIRPFRRERVTFSTKRSPLTAGLSIGDIVLSSGERINGFSADEYLASDAFTYAVDYDEVAPFAQIPDATYFGNSDASNDHNPLNMVNGFFSEDGWQLIFSQWAGSGKPKTIPFPFTEPQTLTEIEWAGNAFYYPTKKIELTFDNSKKIILDTEPNNTPQVFKIANGTPTKQLDLQIIDWEKAKEPAIVGIDNIKLKAARPAWFLQNVHPLLNIGTLMEYQKGAGGIVLCNINFLEPRRESVPENAQKKQRILATILRNLGASFGGANGVIVGTPLTFTPIDISKNANQYRNERGWFGNGNPNFSALPTGKQNFGGVEFNIYDFPTSPVPTCIMLGGNGVLGNLPDSVKHISVNTKADALFFLQTARIDQSIQEGERQSKKRFEMAHYVITYADGKTETIPLYQDEDLADYRQTNPKALPSASLGWTGNGLASYVKQWNNPRPNIQIQEIALDYGKDKRGIPVLLAVTGARQK